jgi:hypothetical protein
MYKNIKIYYIMVNGGFSMISRESYKNIKAGGS